jgi:hypothetical protein
MLRVLSTKIVRDVPREFEADYVRYGHAVCEEMYGKRPVARYKRMVGKLRLNRMRKTAVTNTATSVQEASHALRI